MRSDSLIHLKQFQVHSQSCGCLLTREPIAYFEKSYDRIFGLVYQPDFEARLKRHFETASDHDPSWYALRNAVYAEGCRNVGSGDNLRDFSNIQSEAARYFENALSVVTDLLFTPNGIMAVQALAVMAGLPS